MGEIFWGADDRFGVFDADQPLSAILDACDRRGLGWAVLRRTPGDELFYCYRPEELSRFTLHIPQAAQQPAVAALALHEYQDSPTVPAYEALSLPDPDQVSQPSMLRVVGLDAARQPAAIGEILGWNGASDGLFDAFMSDSTGFGGSGSQHNTSAEPPPAAYPHVPEPRPDVGSHAPADADADADAGGYYPLPGAEGPSFEPLPSPVAANGGAAPEPAKTAGGATLDVTLSAKAPGKVRVGREARIPVRLELTDDARPLGHARGATIAADEDVWAVLSVDRAALDIAGEGRLRLPPPRTGAPSTGTFAVVGKVAGATQLEVAFMQGGTELGALPFTLTVTTNPVLTRRRTRRATAQPRDLTDDDFLVLIIDEQPGDNELRYHYQAVSKLLDWDMQDFTSDAIKVEGEGGSVTKRYARSIYKRIQDRLLETPADLDEFDRELSAMGTELSEELFDDQFLRLIWDRRDLIRGVVVRSREPYVPWEMVRFKHPDPPRRVDERYLCEYGMVRKLFGGSRPRALRRGSWAYLAGTYPCRSLAEVGQEIEYFRTTLPAQGEVVRAIPATKNDFYAALERPDYDVLHIACHGKTDLDNIELTELLISDYLPLAEQVPRAIGVTPTTVRGEANFSERKPLVFLNACQTAQGAASLASFGGWPQTFWDAGAASIVATSWSVHEEPANAFATAFYEALRGGATLSAAATAGRAAAKQLRGASWLAFVVYGEPTAGFT